ncbi:amidohydrolase family protein [Streptomyces sp. HNM0574]|uniref:amidohydrolase family protein n=1 Tax=Streptomyces sp. HNM0574 TaxID=2714954 RepID=UPI00146D3400|nr:amidohydrolase family protein [Streptomyces sp. HNM0574]NLU70389.1 amidohydrolase family protein [Streptomyces sp. HNM0574]
MNRRLALSGTLIALAALTASPSAAAPADPDCFDREKRPYTSVVDSHLHFRPFGGPAIPFEEMTGYLRDTGVRYANVYGIGQTLPAGSDCTYYLSCPGTKVTPSMKNDFANARDLLDHTPEDIQLTLSMTFPDLANPEGVLERMKLLEEEYPGRFRWMGEVNLVKQALLKNAHEPADKADIAAWAPFMKELRDRDIPLTIHSDLGNDRDRTKFLPLMREVLERYPDNEIVWAHMGLSKELSTMDPAQHTAILGQLMDRHPNLAVDISWRVLYDQYFSKREARRHYVPFLNRYADRVLPGTDFVASRDKNFQVYKDELEVTSRINRYLDDKAFRQIALGQSYFDLVGLKDKAPRVCERA